MVVAELPADDKQAARAAKPKPQEQAANRLGLVVSELTPEQRRELRLTAGLLIEDIRGNAARTDLQRGDILLALISKGTNTELRSVEQFNRLLSQFDKGANITLLVRRGDVQTFVTIKGINGEK